MPAAITTSNAISGDPIMKRILVALLFIGFAAAAVAQSTANGIEIDHPWSRASAGRTGVVYLTIKNSGAADDQLTSVSTPIADKAQLHTTVNDNGVMKMRPIAALPVKHGGEVTLKPEGMHVMLIDLHHPLTAGETFPVTLTFAKAGQIETTVTVEKAGSMQSMPGMHM
jgi:periplasmic copper chaperone A